MNEEKNSHEQDAIASAIRAGRMGHSLDPKEQAMLETFPPKDRLAVLVFVRWSRGQKWRGGIQSKLIAKLAFIQAFRIARAIFKGEDDGDSQVEKEPNGAQK